MNGAAYEEVRLLLEANKYPPQVIGAFRAEVRAERDAEIIAWLVKKSGEYGTSNRENRAKAEAVARMADKLSRGAVRDQGEKDTREGESTPADVTVYRASHDSIVMGLYTTATEARAHCVAEERRSWAKGESTVFDWIEDEEDGVAELVTVDDDGETETVTGYVVTALTVASAYDEEADE